MDQHDAERFNIYFAGECLEDKDSAAVRIAIQKLFKADDATMERLFSGTRQLIKRGCDKATALTYQKAISAAGAKPIITRAAAPASQTPESVAEPGVVAGASSPPAQEPTQSPVSLAAPGSDVLAPGERPAVRPVSVATDHLSLAETGTRLAEATPPAPAVPAPDFAVAEVGSNLGPLRPVENGPLPDTSALDLAPAESDLSEFNPPTAPPPQLSLDHLQLAEPGADLLAPGELQRHSAEAPDTSHLQLENPTSGDAQASAVDPESPDWITGSRRDIHNTKP
ncbi:MAG: hypothetical protein ACI87W_002343 [Halieaceae bacterium]|jgi:hypothetical protein